MKLPTDDLKQLQALLSHDREYLLTARQRLALKNALMTLTFHQLVESEAGGSSTRKAPAEASASDQTKPSEATAKGNMRIQSLGVDVVNQEWRKANNMPECACSDPFRPDHPVGKCSGGIGGVR